MSWQRTQMRITRRIMQTDAGEGNFLPLLSTGKSGKEAFYEKRDSKKLS